jgi:hypothetical protein|tara:strand:- start:74 stop:319 length:246 start_codon:yes stop_codon:yes gene_type:complete
MTSNKFSQKDQDFADAMATKLRLNRERLRQAEEANNKINNLSDKRKSEIGDFRLSIIQSAMEDHPDLDVESALEMMDFFKA